MSRIEEKVPSGFPGELITREDAKKLVKSLVTDVELVDYSIRTYSDEKLGFLGSHQRLETTVRSDSCRVSTMTFFVKAMPYDVPTQAEYVRDKGVFEQEAYFYEKLMPELRLDFIGEPWAPECYIIKRDCLIFEDLRLSGFRMREKLFDQSEIRAGLGAIARLHAASLYAEARLGRPLNEIYPGAFEEKAFADRANRWYLAGIDVAVKLAEQLNLDSSKIRTACDAIFEAMKPSKLKQNVTSHGDLWSNNLMFDDAPTPHCRLVDFQLARYSPLSHDVAQLLHLCGSREFRDNHTNAMLHHYYDCLKNCLKVNSAIPVKIPSWQEIETAYEEQRLGAVVTAIMYFPTVLLDGDVGAEIMNNPESYEKFVLEDRRDVVLDIMKRDPTYRRRLNETVEELVEMSMKLDKLPKPC